MCTTQEYLDDLHDAATIQGHEPITHLLTRVVKITPTTILLSWYARRAIAMSATRIGLRPSPSIRTSSTGQMSISERNKQGQ